MVTLPRRGALRAFLLRLLRPWREPCACGVTFARTFQPLAPIVYETTVTFGGTVQFAENVVGFTAAIPGVGGATPTNPPSKSEP